MPDVATTVLSGEAEVGILSVCELERLEETGSIPVGALRPEAPYALGFLGEPPLLVPVKKCGFSSLLFRVSRPPNWSVAG